jgi:branched-chain amino acid transport system ATP-binding protein
MTGYLKIEQVQKRFGGFVALAGVDLTIAPGERVGLIGPNGSGKSTLVNCICGALQNDGGSISFDGRKLDGLAPHQRTYRGISRSFQLPRPFATMTVAENIRIPLLYAVHSRHGRHLSREAADQRCGELAASVGLQDKRNEYPSSLTQVEMRKLELARAMAADPKLLIADESMAGLSDSEVGEIVELLLGVNAQGVSIIMIEHIMKAILEFSQRLVVLVAGSKIADGLPKAVLSDPDVEKAYLGE